MPSTNISATSIYFLSIDGEENNGYEEYIYVRDKWEMIGTTKVDLSNYVTKSSLQPIATQTMVTDVWVGTQTQYDAIPTKESTKLYLIKG